MSEHTNIAWATSTFNPWIGCTKVGPGCDGCYAEALMDARWQRVKWGSGQPRERTSAAYWRKPLAWNKKAVESGKPWRVFCGSLCDIFDNEAPNEWRADLFDLILKTPALTWMLLTKRIGNVSAMAPEGLPANAWIGATVVNQEEADRDIPKLLGVPAAVRFLSIEPMIGPIDLGEFHPFRAHRYCDNALKVAKGILNGHIGWVIVGGESAQQGHDARPFNIDWARDIVWQCKEAGVPVFVKQLGSAPIDASGPIVLRDRAGADPSEWPDDLRVREFPK